MRVCTAFATRFQSRPCVPSALKKLPCSSLLQRPSFVPLLRCELDDWFLPLSRFAPPCSWLSVSELEIFDFCEGCSAWNSSIADPRYGLP